MDAKKQTNKNQESGIKNQEEASEGVDRELELEKLHQELEETRAKYLRSLADYQNLEKRVREEKSEWIKAAGRSILLKLLPVLDTLVLASQHSSDQSLLVTIAQFLDTLKSEGVARIEAKGKKFDPSIMEAVQTVEGEEGKVVDEVRAGFMLHDKLLRPAEVTVGKNSSK